MTSRIASLALTTAFFFLIVVAIMLNSPPLFYMGTALIATLAASRFQAYLAVRGLRFERHVPETAERGELVMVEVTVWSERRIRRPLITIRDHLPPRLVTTDRSPSLPIAPAFDIPIRTIYRFRPMRRGRFRWSDLTVVGTDALGLVALEKVYQIETSELTVLPTPIPIEVPLPPAMGWGNSESEYGMARGSGIEPRGVREYGSGDSMRFVHWRSSARAGKLLVKEFETGSHASVAMLLQQQAGSEVATRNARGALSGWLTTFEQMCGNAAYLADRLVGVGTQVELPNLGVLGPARSAPERREEIFHALSIADPGEEHDFATQVDNCLPMMSPGSVVYIFVGSFDDSVVRACQTLINRHFVPVVLGYDTRAFDQTVAKSAGDDDVLNAVAAIGALTERIPRWEETK